MPKTLLLALCLALSIAVGSGCARKTLAPINTGFTTDPANGSTGTLPTSTDLPNTSVDIPGNELTAVDRESILFNKDNGLVKPIYFDYNSFELSPDALETLRQNADALNQHPNMYVQVEGHCDERGTTEYNMALGDKRAQATCEQLIRLGVSGDRIITITYGEEDPADLGHDEAAWAMNRRCEFAQGLKTR